MSGIMLRIWLNLHPKTKLAMLINVMLVKTCCDALCSNCRRKRTEHAAKTRKTDVAWLLDFLEFNIPSFSLVINVLIESFSARSITVSESQRQVKKSKTTVSESTELS